MQTVKEYLIQWCNHKVSTVWGDYSASYNTLPYLKKELKYLRQSKDYKYRLIERETKIKEKVIE